MNDAEIEVLRSEVLLLKGKVDWMTTVLEATKRDVSALRDENLELQRKVAKKVGQ